MSSHSNRSAYFVCREGVLKDPDQLSPGPPVNLNPVVPEPRRPREPRFKFGRMFPQIKVASGDEESHKAIVAEIVELATTINSQPDNGPGDSDLPGGYTYLGQFIAHEVTFDKTEEPLDSDGTQREFRSPQIDLDSLYGRGPEDRKDRRFYQDAARLKVGETIAGPSVRKTFYNDLPREGFGSEQVGKAIIPDPRNDENLAVAQTHVAFIRFHNKVVDEVRDVSPDQLFKVAKKEVSQHFQWIILKDFLPKLLHKQAAEVLETGEPKFFKPDPQFGVCMPLEFSVAAFRFGHSMVSDKYEWNFVHNSEMLGHATINNLFQFSGFSGDLRQKPRLESDWIIDWRRFYDPTPRYPADGRLSNKARRIDTGFSLKLETIKGFPHVTQDPSHQSIIARNLLRGHACGLPCGEDVAEMLGIKEQDRLTQAQIGIESPLLTRHTPLWYYMLKEAEFNNGKLGPVASVIIAETLVGLIRESPDSILKEKNWKPKYGRRAGQGIFEMMDLLDFAEVVDPLGEHMGRRL